MEPDSSTQSTKSVPLIIELFIDYNQTIIIVYFAYKTELNSQNPKQFQQRSSIAKKELI